MGDDHASALAINETQRHSAASRNQTAAQMGKSCQYSDGHRPAYKYVVFRKPEGRKICSPGRSAPGQAAKRPSPVRAKETTIRANIFRSCITATHRLQLINDDVPPLQGLKSRVPAPRGSRPGLQIFRPPSFRKSNSNLQPNAQRPGYRHDGSAPHDFL